jgi:hypothetical protein
MASSAFGDPAIAAPVMVAAFSIGTIPVSASCAFVVGIAPTMPQSALGTTAHTLPANTPGIHIAHQYFH